MKITHDMITTEGLYSSILVSRSNNKIKKDSSVWPGYIDFSTFQYLNFSKRFEKPKFRSI